MSLKPITGPFYTEGEGITKTPGCQESKIVGYHSKVYGQQYVCIANNKKDGMFILK